MDALATRILSFEDRYNATARPFDWRYTRTDLNDYLARLRRHDPDALPLCIFGAICLSGPAVK